MRLELAEWRRLWNAIGARGDGEGRFDELIKRYSEPGRYYHTAEHIAECLREFQNFEATSAQVNEIAVALWMHDVIYDPKKVDNEEQSVEFTATMLREAAVSDEFTARVSELILATRHHVIVSDAAARVVVDVDLSIFGQPPERFWRYEADVRKEYAFVPEEIFRMKRAEILERFLQRDRIYATAYFFERYEKRARENLANSIQRLRGVIKF